MVIVRIAGRLLPLLIDALPFEAATTNLVEDLVGVEVVGAVRPADGKRGESLVGRPHLQVVRYPLEPPRLHVLKQLTSSSLAAY